MLVGSVASAGLSLAYDYERCIEPLVMDALELSTLVGEWGPAYTVFETWIDDFLFSPVWKVCRCGLANG